MYEYMRYVLSSTFVILCHKAMLNLYKQGFSVRGIPLPLTSNDKLFSTCTTTLDTTSLGPQKPAEATSDVFKLPEGKHNS